MIRKTPPPKMKISEVGKWNWRDNAMEFISARSILDFVVRKRKTQKKIKKKKIHFV